MLIDAIYYHRGSGVVDGADNVFVSIKQTTRQGAPTSKHLALLGKRLSVGA